ncbi:ATP-binding protein [Salinispira pacifica]
MKLFTKTLLSFTGVIVFGSGLIVFFVTNSIQATNRDDARRELRSEAQVTYDNFNSWKRSIWKNLIALQNDDQFSSLLARPVRSARTAAISSHLRALFLRTAYDVVFLSIRPDGYTDVIPINYNTFSLEDLRTLSADRSHPYVEVGQIGSAFAITGVLRVGDASKSEAQIFIIKRIDQPFCDSLVLNRDSHCAFFLDGAYLTGWDKPLSQPSLPFGLTPEDSHAETYAWPTGGESYNVAIQRIPNFSGDSDGRTLTLVTFVPNSPYEHRVSTIGRIVLLVSVASALLTLLISLFLTNNITVPIRVLLSAMRKLQSGEYVQQKIGRPGYEVSRLLSGFNDMAAHLYQDRLAMDQYIKEITFLNQYNEKVIESIGAGILIFDEHGSVQKANTAFLAMFALSGDEITGRRGEQLALDAVDRAVAAEVEAVGSGEREAFQTVKRTKSGRVFELKLYPLSMSDESNRRGCILVVEDISRRTEFETKIYQAEKLSALSMLSAGVAHEINNPLSSIMTNVQNLIMEESDAEKQVSLKWIEQETRRIASTIRELLKFSAPDPDPNAGCDVNSVVTEALTLIGYSVAREQKVELVKLLAPELPSANIGSNELKQVIINLVKNSLQAIPGSGRVTLRTTRRRGRIVLTVADTGSGIPPEVVSHIFDPFYTTKQDGGGTGLGLSVVYGILAKYRGSIRVSSRPGRGTRMTVSLLPSPAAEKRPVRSRRGRVSASSAAGDGRSEQI